MQQVIAWARQMADVEDVKEPGEACDRFGQLDGLFEQYSVSAF